MGALLIITTTVTIMFAINFLTKDLKLNEEVFTKEQRVWIGK